MGNPNAVASTLQVAEPTLNQGETARLALLRSVCNCVLGLGLPSRRDLTFQELPVQRRPRTSQPPGEGGPSAALWLVWSKADIRLTGQQRAG